MIFDGTLFHLCFTYCEFAALNEVIWAVLLAEDVTAKLYGLISRLDSFNFWRPRYHFPLTNISSDCLASITWVKIERTELLKYMLLYGVFAIGLWSLQNWAIDDSTKHIFWSLYVLASKFNFIPDFQRKYCSETVQSTECTYQTKSVRKPQFISNQLLFYLFITELPIITAIIGSTEILGCKAVHLLVVYPE